MTSKQEEAIDEYLRSIGLDPQPNPDEAAGKGDRLIDGVPTEYKTIFGVAEPTAEKLSAAISNRAMNARSQASHVVIDARRQMGVTEAIADRGAVRAINADDVTAKRAGQQPKIDSIRIIFKDVYGRDTDVLIRRKTRS